MVREQAGQVVWAAFEGIVTIWPQGQRIGSGVFCLAAGGTGATGKSAWASWACSFGRRADHECSQAGSGGSCLEKTWRRV